MAYRIFKSAKNLISRKALPKYIRQKAKRVNKRLDAWKKAGLTCNDTQLAEQLLSSFYSDIGKKPSKTDRASERMFMSKSEKEEYNKILDFILYNDEIDLGKRELENAKIRDSFTERDQRRYETFLKKYEDVTDEQSFINKIDEIKKFNDSRVLQAILSSDQYIELSNMGEKANMKVNDVIIKEYEKTGKTYDALYNKVIDLIEIEMDRRK